MDNITEVATQLFDGEKSWSNLTSSEWVNLLLKFPELADECDRAEGWNIFDGFDWVELLRIQPQFADRCDRHNGWEAFDGVEEDPEGGGVEWGCWAELLELQPQFFVKCDVFNGWKSFDGYDWLKLLSAQPQFAEKCDAFDGWNKMMNFRVEWSNGDENGDGGGWCFVDDTGFDRYIPDKYEETFERDEELCIGGISVWRWIVSNKQRKTNLSDDDTSAIIRRLDKSFWLCFLNQSPFRAVSTAEKYGCSAIWRTLTIVDWHYLTEEPDYPERHPVVDFVSRLAKFDYPEDRYDPAEDVWFGDFWDSLTLAFPLFIEVKKCQKCYEDEDEGVSSHKPACSLCAQRFGDKPWSYLLRHRPDWGVYVDCNIWNGFNKRDWERLLNPRWKFLEKTTAILDSYFWENCLLNVPEFADICEQLKGWSTFNEWNWLRLINKHNQFAAKYIEKCFDQECDKPTEQEIIKTASEFVMNKSHKCHSCDDDWPNDYVDWREESGWNDMYGGGVDSSDIIEFRD